MQRCLTLQSTTIDYNSIHMEGTVTFKLNYTFRISKLYKPLKLDIEISLLCKFDHEYGFRLTVLHI